MRLIDADELIKILRDRASENAIMGYLTAYDVTNSIIDDVEEQLTVYDIDKVVKEVRNKAIDDVIKALDEWRGNQKYLLPENIFELLEQLKGVE